MPIYEYECRACGGGFEELVRGAEEEGMLRCPGCGSAEVRRLLSACCARLSGVAGEAGSMVPAGLAGPAGGCGGGGFS